MTSKAEQPTTARCAVSTDLPRGQDSGCEGKGSTSGCGAVVVLQDAEEWLALDLARRLAFGGLKTDIHLQEGIALGLVWTRGVVEYDVLVQQVIPMALAKDDKVGGAAVGRPRRSLETCICAGNGVEAARELMNRVAFGEL